ncbi:hypothetical protein EJ110_NYTH11503 [Nymphaea thermarum]|nr:hypothetical protein EJ110_NYTH11503 [Nymphaea thermarum]
MQVLCLIECQDLKTCKDSSTEKSLHQTNISSTVASKKSILTTSNGKSRIDFCVDELQMHKKKNMNMAYYIQIFKSTCDELQAIGKPVNDHTKVFLLLNALRPEYESFITSMLKPPIPFYKEVVPLLQSHETMKLLNGHEENVQHQIVFYTQ